MKYIDAEKLKSEIKSRMEDCKLPDGKFPTKTSTVRYEELLCLLNYIASLQQEQHVDLEKEIEDHAICMPMSEFTHDSEAECFIEWAREEFKYFFELGQKAGREA